MKCYFKCHKLCGSYDTNLSVNVLLFFTEEVVTKKKTELTTTRQIETRVKRQVVLEDGKVVQDSGPIVETNTTEDTDKQESETTEVRIIELLCFRCVVIIFVFVFCLL